MSTVLNNTGLCPKSLWILTNLIPLKLREVGALLSPHAARGKQARKPATSQEVAEQGLRPSLTPRCLLSIAGKDQKLVI